MRWCKVVTEMLSSFARVFASCLVIHKPLCVLR